MRFAQRAAQLILAEPPQRGAGIPVFVILNQFDGLAGRATGATCARSASGSRQHCKAPLTLTSERKETSALVVLVPGAESGQFPGVLFLQPEPEEPFDAGRNEGCPSNRSREVGRANCLARTVVGLAVYRPSQVQPLSR